MMIVDFDFATNLYPYQPSRALPWWSRRRIETLYQRVGNPALRQHQANSSWALVIFRETAAFFTALPSEVRVGILLGKCTHMKFICLQALFKTYFKLASSEPLQKLSNVSWLKDVKYALGHSIQVDSWPKPAGDHSKRICQIKMTK